MLDRIAVVAAVVLAIIWQSGCLAIGPGGLVNRCGLWQRLTGEPVRLSIGDLPKVPPTNIAHQDIGEVGLSSSVNQGLNVLVDTTGSLNIQVDPTGSCGSLCVSNSNGNGLNVSTGSNNTIIGYSAGGNTSTGHTIFGSTGATCTYATTSGTSSTIYYSSSSGGSRPILMCSTTGEMWVSGGH